MANIALVEDNEDNRMLIGAIIDGDHVLDEYADGLSALQGMTNRPPELALLDISLPGMSGMEVLLAMKQNATLTNIPVVALTAHAMAGDRRRFVEQGFDAYVSKPIVDEQILLDIIQKLLRLEEPRCP